jgi:hypothetical protein
MLSAVRRSEFALYAEVLALRALFFKVRTTKTFAGFAAG